MQKVVHYSQRVTREGSELIVGLNLCTVQGSAHQRLRLNKFTLSNQYTKRYEMQVGMQNGATRQK